MIVLVIKPNDRGETTFVGPVMDTDPEEPADMEEEEVTFGLERDLQSALRANISQLEQGMTISDDGKERITEAGRIDITATDSSGDSKPRFEAISFQFRFELVK